MSQGIKYYKLMKYLEAKIQFENVLEIDSNFAEAHCRLGDTLDKLNHSEEAI